MESIKEFAVKILPVLLPYGVKRVAIFGSFARGGSRERHRHLGGVPRAEEKTSWAFGLDPFRARTFPEVRSES